MKKYRFLSLLLTVLTLAGCTKNAETGTPNADLSGTAADGTEPAETAVLTNVFAGEAFALPEGMEFCGGVMPYYDDDAGTYTILAQTEDVSEAAFTLLTYDETGAKVDERALVTSEKLMGESGGVIFENGVVLRLSAFNMTTLSELSTLARVDEDGTVAHSEDLAVMCGVESDFISPDDYAVDADGWTYMALYGDVFVMDEQLSLQFSLPCSADTLTEVDGTIYIGTPHGIAPIDKTTRSLGTEVPLPDGLSAEECFPGAGFSLCYRTSQGIFGVTEDGTSELLLNFGNSGLIPTDVTVLHAAGRDTFLLFDGSETAVWNRAADIDLSDVTVLDLAYTGRNTALLRKVVEFNKTHHDIRIVTKDYSVYVNGSIRTGEASMLIPDMLTGVYRPDIFFTSADSAKELSELYAKGLFTDLYPLLDADDTFSRDDLFGCVKRTYETEDGQLAAICGSFRVESLIGGTEILGGRKSWTITEMVEYAQSLPEDVSFMPELAANNAAEVLLGAAGYTPFVDQENHTCSFDSPEFLAYLEFLAALPEKYDYSIYDTVARRDVIAAGNYAVQSKSYLGFSEWMTDKFSSAEEITRIGYAAAGDGDGGSYIKASPYLITSFCKKPEAAWTFIREMLLEDLAVDENWSPMRSNFPALKSAYEEASELSQGYVYRQRSLSRYDPENPPTDKDGPYAFFTEEDSAELAAWLDEEVGIRYSGILSDEITDIVKEEISAYLGGVRTAEACADIIQSRVSLWLSEHE